VDFDTQFNKIYDHVSDSIASGDCQEIVFENIDTVLAIIWNQEDSTSGLYNSLESEIDKKNFLKDFQSSAEWLMGWNRDDLSDEDLGDLAKVVLQERTS
jgi:hypothetical protein